MVEGYANIVVRGVTHARRLSPLECARIWAQGHGFGIDAEPTGLGDGWKVTARSISGDASVTRSGKTIHEAVTKLIEDMQ